MKRGRPFEPGNKLGRGRPPGSRNKRRLQAQQLLEEQSQTILHKAVAVALEGDSQLLRALLPYILRRPEEPRLELGGLATGTAEEISKTSDDILRRAASGQLSLREAQGLALLVDNRRRALETMDLERRLRALEQAEAFESGSADA